MSFLEGPIPTDPEQLLFEQILDDTTMFAQTGIDQKIINTYNSKTEGGEIPNSPTDNPVYFYINRQDPATDSTPTVSLIHKPSENSGFSHTIYGVREGLSLMRGDTRLLPDEVAKITSISRGRAFVPAEQIGAVSSKRLEKIAK